MEDEFQSERIGLIDLGSNSARFVIMNIAANHSYQLIHQDKRLVRLSEGLQEKSVLTPAARERTLHALNDFAHTAALMGVDTMLAVATAAMRTAKNGMAFRDEVEAATSIPLTIISGREEARLGYLGVINTIPEEDFVLFDLGGASTEISLVRHRRLQHSVSLPFGALTLTERFGTHDRVTAKQRRAIGDYVRTGLEKIPGLCQGPLK